MEWIKKYWPAVGFVIVSLLIIGPWLVKPGFLFFTDFVWGPILALDWTSGWLYLCLIIKLVSSVLGVALTQKLFIGVISFLVLLAGYCLARRFATRSVSFLVGLFALFNPFVYDRFLYGQIGVVLSFGFLLLTVAELILFYRERDSTRHLGLAGLWAGLAIMFSPHFIFIAGLVFVVVIIAKLFNDWLCHSGEGRNLESSFRTWIPAYAGMTKGTVSTVLVGLLLAFVVAFGLNANWLLPNFSGTVKDGQSIANNIGKQDLLAFQTAGNNSLDAYKNVAMMSGFWGKDQYRYFDLSKFKENWGRSFLFLSPVILYGLYLGLKRRETRILTISLLFAYLLAVVLAVGIKSPATGALSFWLFDHLPFYKGMREPQKWVALVVAIYAVFLSIGLAELFKKKLVADNKIIVTLFLGAVIVMQAPLLLWGMSGQVKSAEYPADWYQTDQLMKVESLVQVEGGKYKVERGRLGSEGCVGNTLFLPWHMYMSFKWIGNVVANPAPTFFSCPIISGTNMEWGGIYDNGSDSRGRDVERWLATKGKGIDLCGQYNVQYVILAKEVDWQKYLWLDTDRQLELVKDLPTLRLYRFKLK